MAEVGTTELRRRFAAGLSRLYAREVPAYQQLLDATAQVNAEVVAARGSQVQRHGGIDRVTAERHGAVRVGTPAELRQLGVVLAAFGMHPVGFYDLRGRRRRPGARRVDGVPPAGPGRAGGQPVPAVRQRAGARGPPLLPRPS